jgi:hypothetical protein
MDLKLSKLIAQNVIE